MHRPVQRVIVLGGGSAGFMAAMALKAKISALDVLVIRSRDIGIIGVGEGSSYPLTKFLHEFMQVGQKKFFQVAQPTWKLGLKFLWGPRSSFNYTFGPGVEHRLDTLSRTIGYYCDEGMNYYDILSSMMAHDRVFPRGADGKPQLHNFIAYHFENEKFVTFLEGYATALGVRTLDDTVLQVNVDDGGVAALVMKGGGIQTADLYIDASGFRSELLGKALGEPFVSFKSSLFCDRAVVGGWERTDEPIKPYTTCETMESGWAWQIEHETRINRGYVYASDFISDEDAEREFKAKNPKVNATRIVRFISGRYERAWVKNVVAVGNACGFVEPLEATALGVIGVQSMLLTTSLIDTDRIVPESHVAIYNRALAGMWNSIRAFLAIHYKFNTRLQSPFWQACREKTDLAESAEIVEFYQENGPSAIWEKVLVKPFEQFGLAGYYALLVGQRVPYRRQFAPGDKERALWQAHCERNKAAAMRAISVKDALALLHGRQALTRS